MMTETKQLKGYNHTTGTVHYAEHAKHAWTGEQILVQSCGMSRRQLASLGEAADTDAITCKKCQKSEPTLTSAPYAVAECETVDCTKLALFALVYVDRYDGHTEATVCSDCAAEFLTRKSYVVAFPQVTRREAVFRIVVDKPVDEIEIVPTVASERGPWATS